MTEEDKAKQVESALANHCMVCGQAISAHARYCVPCALGRPMIMHQDHVRKPSKW